MALPRLAEYPKAAPARAPSNGTQSIRFNNRFMPPPSYSSASALNLSGEDLNLSTAAGGLDVVTGSSGCGIGKSNMLSGECPLQDTKKTN